MAPVKQQRGYANDQGAELSHKTREGKTLIERTYQVPECVQRAMGHAAQLGRDAVKEASKKK